MTSESSSLSEQQQDVLRELGNVGAGHAATALSVLLGQTVRMSVTAARLCEFEEISDVVGGTEMPVVGIFLQLTGGLHGSMFLLLPLSSARQLLRHLHLPGDGDEGLSELAMSALAEVGNILSGSYLTAIAEMSSLVVQLSVPAVALDMAGAILDVGFMLSGDVADRAILINTSIWQGDRSVDGHFFLLPHPESMAPLFEALGCKL